MSYSISADSEFGKNFSAELFFSTSVGPKRFSLPPTSLQLEVNVADADAEADVAIALALATAAPAAAAAAAIQL